MKRSRKQTISALAALAVLVVFTGKGLDNGLTVQRYSVETDKLSEPVRMVFLSDLHSCDYGEGQAKLLNEVEAQCPDLVLLGGDWVDDDFRRLDAGRAYEAAQALAERWPVFYVTGNHEILSGRAEEIKEKLAGCGVSVLSGSREQVEIRGQRLQICGLEDPAAGETAWRDALAELGRDLDRDLVSVLLTHRPERAEDYGSFDLVLAGHAHGGQWRIPGLINGLIAPDQGLFPAYAGGSYVLEGGGTLIVGRGLARESTRLPRFYNPPEVVAVDLLPAVSQESKNPRRGPLSKTTDFLFSEKTGKFHVVNCRILR